MSKSASSPAGIIEMLDDPTVLGEEDPLGGHRLRLRGALRRREKPGVSNLLTIYSALTGRPIADLEAEYAGRGYGDLKKELADVVVDFVTPVPRPHPRAARRPGRPDRGARRGAEQAGAVAEATLRDVYQRVGFVAAGR